MQCKYDKLVRIKAGDEWLTVIVREGTDNFCERPLSYMRNWSLWQINSHCKSQGWDLRQLGTINCEGIVEDLKRWNVI